MSRCKQLKSTYRRLCLKSFKFEAAVNFKIREFYTVHTHFSTDRERKRYLVLSNVIASVTDTSVTFFHRCQKLNHKEIQNWPKICHYRFTIQPISLLLVYCRHW